jgi:hypothetical protein
VQERPLGRRAYRRVEALWSRPALLLVKANDLHLEDVARPGFEDQVAAEVAARLALPSAQCVAVSVRDGCVETTVVCDALLCLCTYAERVSKLRSATCQP